MPNVHQRRLTVGAADQKDTELLGAISDATKINEYDRGKLTKLAAASFELCEAGDLIDGQVESLADGLANGGYRIGTVRKGPRMEVAVKTANTAAVGSIVVAAAQVAWGDSTFAEQPYVNGLVDLAGDQGTTKSRWRIYSILGDATAANCKVIIERF